MDKDPKVIWLAPECIDGPHEGRCWSEDKDFDDCDCGADPPHKCVKYVRDDTQPSKG